MKNKITTLSKELYFLIISNIKSKKFDEALVLLDKLTDQNSDIVNSFKGSIYINKKDWEKSLFYYQKISDEKKNFKILNNIGFALFKLGKFSKASIKYTQSIDHNKTFIPAYENLVISYKLIGNYDLSIKYILQGLDLMPKNQTLKFHLIDIFNYHQPKINQNVIINTNHLINELDPVKGKDILIQSSSIKNILEKSEEILKDKDITFYYPKSQILRRNKERLHCGRQFGIFNKYKIIPKFCFSCYKVQITLTNVLDLIKLYFYFNNLYLKKNNTRKCMIELRENVSGNYKGYLYAGSINEAKNIKKVIANDLMNKEINLEKIEIKHGCTEYYDKFKLYKNIDEDITDRVYQKEWDNIEKEFDRDNLIKENIKERIFDNTLNKFGLPDFLIIKNWLLYAKIINDDSINKIFKFNIKTSHLSKIEIEKIQLRSLNN
tara:strand:+ start:200 stop:1504 length:1305 start_codon:yes stop_codon:yes gene_type:complete